MGRLFPALDRRGPSAVTTPDFHLVNRSVSSPSTHLWIAALTGALIIVCLFAAYPGIDIFVSQLFFVPHEGFYLRQNFVATNLNALLKHLLEVFAAVSLVMCLLGLLPRFRKKARVWLFFVLAIVLGPGVIVNLVLKSNVGRARPRTTDIFGGDHLFTPILQVADQCAQNCSFSSGEVAMTSTVVFASLAVIWSRLSARGRLAAALAGGALIVLSAGLRVGLGAHFLSDTLASTAISALVVLLTWRVTAMDRPPAG